MDEHDLDGGTLLVIVGRHGRLIEADQQQNSSGSGKPRQQPCGQRQEPGRVGEIDQRHGIPDNRSSRDRQCDFFCFIPPPRELIEVNISRGPAADSPLPRTVRRQN